MRVKLYSNPQSTGWHGWLEDCKGNVIGFIKLDGLVVFDW